jgi:hypothetical protein
MIRPCVIARLSVTVITACTVCTGVCASAHCSVRTCVLALCGYCLTAVSCLTSAGCVLWPLAFEVALCLVWKTLIQCAYRGYHGYSIFVITLVSLVPYRGYHGYSIFVITLVSLVPYRGYSIFVITLVPYRGYHGYSIFVITLVPLVPYRGYHGYSIL